VEEINFSLIWAVILRAISGLFVVEEGWVEEERLKFN
jgi:hypothetical protein